MVTNSEKDFILSNIKTGMAIAYHFLNRSISIYEKVNGNNVSNPHVVSLFKDIVNKYSSVQNTSTKFLGRERSINDYRVRTYTQFDLQRTISGNITQYKGTEDNLKNALNNNYFDYTKGIAYNFVLTGYVFLITLVRKEVEDTYKKYKDEQSYMLSHDVQNSFRYLRDRHFTSYLFDWCLENMNGSLFQVGYDFVYGKNSNVKTPYASIVKSIFQDILSGMKFANIEKRSDVKHFESISVVSVIDTGEIIYVTLPGSEKGNIKMDINQDVNHSNHILSIRVLGNIFVPNQTDIKIQNRTVKDAKYFNGILTLKMENFPKEKVFAIK